MGYISKDDVAVDIGNDHVIFVALDKLYSAVDDIYTLLDRLR